MSLCLCPSPVCVCGHVSLCVFVTGEVCVTVGVGVLSTSCSGSGEDINLYYKMNIITSYLISTLSCGELTTGSAANGLIQFGQRFGLNSSLTGFPTAVAAIKTDHKEQH